MPMLMPMTQAQLLSIGEAANRLGISVDTLRRWSNEGRVPAVTLPSGHRRFRLEDIEAMVTGRSA